MDRRIEPGDSRRFPFEFGRRLYFGAGDEIHRLQIGGTGKQYDIAALDAGGDHRAGADAGKHRLAAHDRHRADRAAANLHRLDVQAVLGE